MRRRTDVRWQARVGERVKLFVIGKQIRPTQLGLLVDDRFDQLQIGVEECRLARQIALDQRFTNEDRSRLGRIRRTIVARTCQQRQAEQTDVLGGRHFAACRIPLRMQQHALDQMRRDTLQPVRFDRGIGARERSEEHTSELQSLMRISYAVFCLKKKNKTQTTINICRRTYNREGLKSEYYLHD